MSHTATPIYRTVKLSKTLGGSSILTDISVDLYSNEVTLLLGPNGAGKSTLLRILSGLLRSDSGKLEPINGINPPSPKIAHSGHNLFLYEDLTVGENLELHGGLVGVKVDLQKIGTMWEFQDRLSTRVSELSAGYKRRVSLARAFIYPASTFLLDEPTTALDDRSVKLLVNNINGVISLGSTVLIATHDLHNLTAIASRILLIRDGKIDYDTHSTRETSIGERIQLAINLYRDTNR